MTDALTAVFMSPEHLEVTRRALDPKARFHSLAHLIEVAALGRAFDRIRAAAAVGVDGITVEQYGQNLQGNLEGLHHRMKSMKYRHQPIRKMNIPKVGGQTRPIGISTVEDKVVQGALKEVLEWVYEPMFHDNSYGFRPGRSAHDAVRLLQNTCFRGQFGWVLEADIRSFFDSINRQMLQKMLQERVPDGSIKRLVGKCLTVGILEGVDLTWTEDGTTQGSVLSPLLGNIYLHYVLDLWFEKVVKPRLHGQALLARYADDFVILFESREDAERVLAALPARMEKFSLSLHPDKTRLVPFGRPRKEAKKGPGTFDFLGFTFYWRRTRSGRWAPAVKTKEASSRRFLTGIFEWCRSHRHVQVVDQHKKLCQKIRGFFQYFGVNGNLRSLTGILYWAKRAWGTWLRRRSQKTRLTWSKFYGSFLSRHPLPQLKVYVQIWG